MFGPEAILLPGIFLTLILLVIIGYVLRKELGRVLGMTAREHRHAQQDFVQAYKEGLDEEEKVRRTIHD